MTRNALASLPRVLIRPITIAELLAQGQDLFDAHHAEVELDLSDRSLNLPLDIDEGIFLAMERAGILITLGLFSPLPVEGLVGYAVGTVTMHHFTMQRVTQALALFVASGFRKHGNGRALMNAFEAASAERDAIVHWHAKKGSTFEAILQSRGARELETVFVAKEPK